MLQKKGVFLTILFVCVFLISLYPISALSDETIERSFTVSPGGTLTIDSDLGSIDVKTVTDNKVNIRIVQKFEGWDKEEIKEFMDNFKIDFSQTGKDVTVTAKLQKNKPRGWNHISVKFQAEVPADYNVDLATSGGSIGVGDLNGTVTAHTSGGSLDFGQIGGPVNGKTSGGSISLDGSGGNADLKTSGGSISIGSVKGSVDAKTSGGSVTLKKADGEAVLKTSGGSINVEDVRDNIIAETSGGSVTAHISGQPSGNCQLETSGGSVTLYLAKGTAVDVDAKTGGGTVRSELDISGQKDEHGRWVRGKINGGGPQVYLRTSGGNIYLKQQ